MTSWIRAWYHRYQEEKKILRGHLETSFNNLLNIKAVSSKDTKDGEREDYSKTVWEGIWMSKNGANNAVSLELQAKDGFEQLNTRARLETSNIKSDPIAVW